MRPVIQKKAHKYKIIKKLYVLWFTYIRLFVFYIKLTYLTQKLKNLDSMGHMAQN